MKRNMICLCIATIMLLALSVFTNRLMEAAEVSVDSDAADENQIITAIFDYDQLEMPIISIVTRTGKDVESKTDYIDATLTILGVEEKYNYDQMEI